MADPTKCSKCGWIHDWTAHEQVGGSFIVSAGDKTVSLVSAAECGFSGSQARWIGYMLCERVCLERQLAAMAAERDHHLVTVESLKRQLAAAEKHKDAEREGRVKAEAAGVSYRDHVDEPSRRCPWWGTPPRCPLRNVCLESADCGANHATPAPEPWTPKAGPAQVTYCPPEISGDWSHAGETVSVYELLGTTAKVRLAGGAWLYIQAQNLIRRGSEDARWPNTDDRASVYLGRHGEADLWFDPADPASPIWVNRRTGGTWQRVKNPEEFAEGVRRALLRNRLPKEAKPDPIANARAQGLHAKPNPSRSVPHDVVRRLVEAANALMLEIDPETTPAHAAYILLGKCVLETESAMKGTKPPLAASTVSHWVNMDTMRKLLCRAEAVAHAHSTGNVNGEQMGKLRQEAAALRAEVGEDEA